MFAELKALADELTAATNALDQAEKQVPSDSLKEEPKGRENNIRAVESDVMQSYNDLVKLARICVLQARETTNPLLSTELMRMAKLYQHKAAELDGGKLPDIGEDDFGTGQFNWTGRYLWGNQRSS